MMSDDGGKCAMKSSGFTNKLSPLYVLAAGIIGSIIPVFLYVYNYPHQGDPKGEAFVSVAEYWVWIFLFMVLFAILTIFFIPAWLSLIQNFRVRILNVPGVSPQRALLKLIVAALLLVGFLWVVNQIASEANLQLMALYPDGHRIRTQIVSICV